MNKIVYVFKRFTLVQAAKKMVAIINFFELEKVENEEGEIEYRDEEGTEHFFDFSKLVNENTLEVKDEQGTC